MKSLKRILVGGLLALIVATSVNLATQLPSNAEQNFYSLTVRNTISAFNVFTRGLNSQAQAVPAAKTAASTISVADMLKKVVTLTQATGATVALTVDTGTLIQAGLPRDFAIGDSFDFTIINLSSAAADTGTLTAASGTSIVGKVIIPSAHSTTIADSSSTYRVKKTATNTFVIYAVS